MVQQGALPDIESAGRRLAEELFQNDRHVYGVGVGEDALMLMVLPGARIERLPKDYEGWPVKITGIGSADEGDNDA